MIGHGFVCRYIIAAEQKTLIILVPRYQCRDCRHTICVLPQELHNHCNHVSQTIVEMISARLDVGRFSNKQRISKSLRRHWYNLYLHRCQEHIHLVSAWDIAAFLRELPPFSVLYRSAFTTLHLSKIQWCRRETHRSLLLVVCLDSS